MRVLVVVNKRLPLTDYRIRFPWESGIPGLECVYGMPGRSEGLSGDCFVPMGFGEGIGVGDLRNFVQLFLHLRSHRAHYHCAHFFSTKLQLLGPLIARLAGVRSIITVTGFGRTFSRPGLGYLALRGAYLRVLGLSVRSSEKVLFQNHSDLDWICSLWPQQAYKLAWVGSAVDFPVRNRDYRGDGEVGVLIVARLLRDKGIREFLSVARSMSGSGVRFRVVGPPSHGEGSVLSDVLAADAGGQVRYLGELEGAALVEEYSRNHILLFPSLTEGLPRVLLEAAHCGLCPIVADIAGVRDLVQEGRGFCLSVDPQDFVRDACLLLAKLRDDRACLESNALTFQGFVLRGYSMRAYSQRLDTILRELGDDRLGNRGEPKRQSH